MRAPGGLHWFVAAGRLLFGYILAVAVGALLFALVGNIALPGGFFGGLAEGDTTWVDQMTSATLIFFIVGLVFGLPYTILALLAFRFLLPRNVWTLLAIGLPGPAAAIFLAGICLGGTIWWNGDFALLALMTIPAALVATYLFGAVGLGMGFGGWRL